MDDTIYKEHEQSEFNAGIATLERLHEIKKHLDTCNLKNDPHYHYQCIKMFFKELRPMFTDELKLQKTRWDFGKKIEPLLISKDKIIPGHIMFLEMWEIELRILEQDKGMNMPKRKDARFAMGNR